MPTTPLAAAAADLLSAGEETLGQSPCLVGLDGFVDTILHVVATRENAANYTRIEKMAEFSQRITGAIGLSTNFEMVQQMVKLGGNGPIMANALDTYGAPVTYVGLLGTPNLHPVFADFAKRAKVISLAEPGYTDAIEFDDGKLMLGKNLSLGEVTWENLLAHISLEEMVELFNKSALIALVNWTMLAGMTGIFEALLAKVMPRVAGSPWIFFDLADPTKRTREDIAKAIDLIAKFSQHARVILGLNLKEGRQIGEVLDLPAFPETASAVAAQAAKIRERLGLETVVIHHVSFAAGADRVSHLAVKGPLVEKPRISTGAGDHFNAGFCIACLLHAPLDLRLQIGVATSSYYVGTGKTPSTKDMVEFLNHLSV